MSQAGLVLAVLVVWLSIGVVLWLVLGRRGHDGTTWFLIGTLLGPLGVLLAVDAVQHDEPAAALLEVPGGGHAGNVDILVGADGSPAARAALRSAIDLFGPSLGRVTFVRVVPFDGGLDADREARRAAEAEAARSPQLEPGIEVRRGHPATVIAEVARQGEYDLVVVGTRAEGRHPFGSTARELATTSPVPVLLVSAPGRTSAATDTEPAAEPVGKPATDTDSAAEPVGKPAAGGDAAPVEPGEAERARAWGSQLAGGRPDHIEQVPV